jgi:hypothetical protein
MVPFGILELEDEEGTLEATFSLYVVQERFFL